METTLDSAPRERVVLPKAGIVPAFVALTALFSLADAGPRGLLALTALSAAKAALFLYFFPGLGD